MKEKFLIIDGSSLLYRAFFALPLLSNKDGEYTNGVYGFLTMLTKILNSESPNKVVVCFDKSRVTFRNEIFSDYKGHRNETPNELIPQFQLMKELLQAMGICSEELEGYEADDLIGTLATNAKNDHEVLILTGDRDAWQLINENTKVMLTKKGITQTEIWDEAALREKFDLTPAQIIDLKALMGDTSDNIPGINGVGEKTALKLLHEYHTVEQVLANSENITAKALKKKIAEGKEQAEISKKLAAINCEIPGYADLDKYAFAPVPLQENPPLVQFYKRLGFNSLLAKVAPLVDTSSTNSTASSAAQTTPGDLFASVNFPANKFMENQEQLIAEIGDEKSLALDLTKGYLGIATSKGDVFTLNLADIAPHPIWTNQETHKISVYNKELSLAFRQQGVELHLQDDLALAAYLLNPAASNYQPHMLGATYFNTDKIDEKKYQPEQIAALNASLILPLWDKLKQLLDEEQLWSLYNDLELPLTKVLAEMQICGIHVNKEFLNKMAIELSAKEAQLAIQIYDLAGNSFNINSPKQLGDVLFNQMGIPPIKKTKTGFSTDVEVLEQLSSQYEIAGKILDYRSYAKLRSTYAEGLQNLIDNDGKIHTSLNQTVAATGRLSSTEPNLQNIPVRDELGRKLRAAFTASDGCLLLAADYSQIELRVLAHIADDKVLQNSFINNEDIHARTAAEIFGITIPEVTREQRRRAKAVNFGIVYGISDFGLAKDLGIPRYEAKEYIDKYLAGYEGVSAYMKNIIIEGKSKGYVQTMLGRKRWLPDLQNRNFNLRSFAERMALNTPIQGTAADIIKIAMLKIQKRLQGEKLQTKMLLQVHDELIFDVPEAELEQAKILIRQEMENAYQLNVPTTVDIKIGKDWYNMNKI